MTHKVKSVLSALTSANASLSQFLLSLNGFPLLISQTQYLKQKAKPQQQ